MMYLIKPGFYVNLMGQAKKVAVIAGILVLASWLLVFTKGLNFGIDFAGGTEALVQFKQGQVDVAELRKIAEETGLDTPEVVNYGLSDDGSYLIRSRSHGVLTEDAKVKIKSAIVAEMGEPSLWDDSDETGEEIRVQYKENKDKEKFVEILKNLGFNEAAVSTQSEGTNPVLLLNLGGVKAQINKDLKAKYGEKYIGIVRLESVGSAVGQQLRNQGILAVLYAMIAILVYVGLRFDLRYAPGAVVALFHDVSLPLGVFCIFNVQFDLTVVAALLAIVGYSLNDTIVIYDRIREMLKLGEGKDLADTINRSLCQTLTRTAITSITTFLAVIALFVWGGGSLHGFSLTMLLGIVFGTFSSLYIASPAVLVMDGILKKRHDAAKAAAEHA